MICLACSESCRRGLCGRCAADLRPGGERWAGGLVVRAGLVHVGAARRLVHRLKYQGVQAAAGVLAEAMIPLLESPPSALVPVPRAISRLWRYGVDPGWELAAALGSHAGVPVIRGLRAGWWHRRRAGGRDAARSVPRFGVAAEVPQGSVLVDDVITTGTTLAAAASRLRGVAGAVTATAALSATAVSAPPGRCRPTT